MFFKIFNGNKYIVVTLFGEDHFIYKFWEHFTKKK